jgi:hypothetical protein
LERLRRRAAAPEFQPAIARLHEEEQRFLTMGLTVPELPAGYYHDYVCPEHGIELRFGPDPQVHQCPVDGRRFAGRRFDAAWRWFVNHEISEAALELAVLHRIEGGRLEALRGILLAYGDRYKQYARTPRDGANPGVATYTTLDESVWSVPLAWAFALVREDFSPADQARIVNRLFLPAAEHLVRRHYRSIHNFSCWHNAAIATLGRVSERADLVRSAVDGPYGQRAQLRDGMLPDGLWYEGSMSYHFYALWAILVSGLAARHEPSLNIFGDSAIAGALRAPIFCAYADGSLPATNDCWFFTSISDQSCHGVPSAASFYEIGLAIYGDPDMAGVLNRTYSRVPRDSVHALLFGVEEIPPANWPTRKSFCLSASGLAFLRPPGGLDLMLKFGPHGGDHGHPDKLGLTGSLGAWKFSPDLGTPAYGVESLETWYRRTLSHNTVLIDGLSQPPAGGALRRLHSERLPYLADAAVEWEGVAMRRLVLTCAEYFVDLFQVRCATSRRIDWIWHNAGAIETDGCAEPTEMGGCEAFRHLSEARVCHRASVVWQAGSHSLTVWFAPCAGEKVYTGRSPANPPSELYGFLLRQRQGSETTFLSVLHPCEKVASVRNVIWGAPGLFEVELENRRDHWDLSLLPDGPESYAAQTL